MVTARNMQIFLEVCRCNCNMTKAAQNLYLSQPAVTIVIHELEESFGVPLFDRIGRRCYLTEAGKDFMQYCEQMESLLKDMQYHMFNWEEQGVFRIGASMTVGSTVFPLYLKSFLALMPNVKVKAVIHPSRQLVQKVLSRELDMALIETPLNASGINAKVFHSDKIDLICPAVPPYKNGLTILPEELPNYPLLLRERGSGCRDILESILKQENIHIEPFLESSTANALINAVIMGLGISFIPHMTALNAIRAGKVYTASLHGITLHQNFYLITNKGKAPTKAMKVFETCATDGNTFKQYSSELPDENII